MNRKQLEAKIQKRDYLLKIKAWWANCGYKILSVILWFIAVPMWIYQKVEDRKLKNFTENKTKIKKYLDKLFPRMVGYYYSDATTIIVVLGYSTEFLCTEDFVDSWIVGNRFARYFLMLTFEQREQMIMDYEIGGYEKKLLSNWQDYDKAVMFYIADSEE